MIRTMYVLYDATCGLCSRLRSWVQGQRALVRLEFIAAGSPRARALFPQLDHAAVPRELVVVTDSGAEYVDDRAWIMTLWALAEYRSWAYRFARGPLRPFARAAWDFLSSNRSQLAELLALKSDRDLAAELSKGTPEACEVPYGGV